MSLLEPAKKKTKMAFTCDYGFFCDIENNELIVDEEDETQTQTQNETKTTTTTKPMASNALFSISVPVPVPIPHAIKPNALNKKPPTSSLFKQRLYSGVVIYIFISALYISLFMPIE